MGDRCLTDALHLNAGKLVAKRYSLGPRSEPRYSQIENRVKANRQQLAEG
jgi:hypothetical protein